MTRRNWDDDDPIHDEDFEDASDGEDPGDDGDVGDDDATLPCPYCGAMIFDDSVRCPRCERYLSDQDAPNTQPVRWWILIGVAACFYAVYRWTFG